MANLEAADRGHATQLARIGGAAALLGGLAWTIKGLMILAGANQPPLLFETAPALFGIGLLCVAHSTMHPGRRQTIVLGLAAGAAVVGLAALLTELAGDVMGEALAISSVALLIGLLMLERDQRWPARLAWWIGVAMVPALVLGGLLSEIDERLLEIPLVLLGVAWGSVGWTMLRTPPANPTNP